MKYQMHKTLFLLCPTDCLEPIVNDTFKHENYFYSSLGNSFISDIETIKYIKELVKKQNIQKIYFILSEDNKIILDALGSRFFGKVRGLKKQYANIVRQQEHSQTFWHTEDSQFSILSYYLNDQIKKLQFELGNLCSNTIKIRGKIYNRHEDIFKNIYHDLVCVEKYSLN